MYCYAIVWPLRFPSWKQTLRLGRNGGALASPTRMPLGPPSLHRGHQALCIALGLEVFMEQNPTDVPFQAGRAAHTH